MRSVEEGGATGRETGAGVGWLCVSEQGRVNNGHISNRHIFDDCFRCDGIGDTRNVRVCDGRFCTDSMHGVEGSVFLSLMMRMETVSYV